jgi:subtilisin-like proprotein convertase family protein
MRPAPPQGPAPGDRGRAVPVHRLRSGRATKARRRRLALEALEPRTLLAVLPPPTVGATTPIFDATPNGNNSAPSIAVDPTNPDNLAAAWVLNDPVDLGPMTPVQVFGAFSNDGGQTWNSLPVPGVLIDPSTGTNPAPFAQVTDPSVAFDRAGNFYLVESQHATDNHSGGIIASQYTADGTPTANFGTIVTEWNQSDNTANQVGVFRPFLAVDSNVASFTDPDTGVVQADPSAGNVYIAWSADTPAPSGATNWNRHTIQLVTSSDGAGSFGAPVDLGHGHSLPFQETSPRLAVSQGDIAGRVQPGQVTVIWDDYGIGATASPPQDVIFSQVVTGGGSAPGALGFVAATTVRGALAASYPNTFPNSGSMLTDPLGVGPGATIAADSTLGSFSPHQGRIYVAYVDRYNSLIYGAAAGANPADNTDVFLKFSDNGGTSWNSAQVDPLTGNPLPANDDNGLTDGYSGAHIDFTEVNTITGRPQFQPELAVDQMTGTVALSFLDARYDAARARVATTLTTSVDGGITFSPQDGSFADPPEAPVDAITGQTDKLAPIPSNQSTNGNPDATFAFGEHQGLAFADGHLYPAFASNFNGDIEPNGFATRLQIVVASATTAVGPRVVAATMGPVGQPGDRVNADRAADGTPEADALQVTFDRPVDPATFTAFPDQPPAAIFSATFENGADGFTADNNPIPDPNYAPGLWHLSTGRGGDANRSGTHGFYYGQNEGANGGGNYNTPGFANRGVLSSPAIALPANKRLNLQFNYFLQTEGAAPGFDNAIVQVDDLTTGQVTQLADNEPGGGLLDPSNTFRTFRADLSPFAGDTIELQFRFDTEDSQQNDSEGWYVDDVQVLQPQLIADVHFLARDVNGNPLPMQPVPTGVTPLDPGPFGATTFLVRFTPVAQAGTISYSIGPDVQDRIRTVLSTGSGPVTVNGNQMDQNADGTAGETSTTVPNQNDAFAAPRPLNGVPFTAPYDTTTLPLIVPGPHILAEQTYPSLDAFPRTITAAPNPATPSILTSTLAIAGDPNAQITHIAVHLDIAFPNDPALVLTLVAPDGTRVVLSRNEPQFGGGADFTATTFDDDGPTPIAAGSPPYDGVFRPEQSLAKALAGHSPNGTWTLEVENDGTGATGTLSDWSLRIGTTAVALDKPLDTLHVTFDRAMDPSRFTAANIVSVVGPNGPIAGPFTVTLVQPGDPDYDPNYSRPDRTFRIGIPPQSLNGTYSLVLDANVRSAAGDAIDANLNAGLDVLRGTATGVNVPVTVASKDVPKAISPGRGVDSTLDVTDNFVIQGVTLTLNITFPNDPDLTATLITPQIDPATGQPYRIVLFSKVGASGNRQNFSNTTFDDNAKTPIQNGGPPFFGTFDPQQPLTIPLVGTQAAGRYTLEISDSSGVNKGTLNSWSMTFLKSVPITGLGEPVADRQAVKFRVFNSDPTGAIAGTTWAPIGPAGIGARGADLNGQTAGRVNAVAVDPSDPSGNTVYAGGASGGIFRTTDFLTTSPTGPTWTPLTDFGPVFGSNIGSIAVFPRNGDPAQSTIFAVTGEGSALGDPTQSALSARGVGVLRSTDGGATWTLLDSTDNTLPYAQRDHAFAKAGGTAGFKVLADPKPGVGGGLIVYMAISDVNGSGAEGGVWRSLDGGAHWTRMLAGQATDIALDLNSGTGTPGGNLQILYAAMRGQGVFFSPNRGQNWSLMTGGIGDPLIQNQGPPNAPVPVRNGGTNPNGAGGRLVLARPALTGNPLEDVLYQGYLYVAAVAPDGHLGGLYMTKDFGQNWAKLRLPADPVFSTIGPAHTVELARQVPTNDTTQADYDPLGSTTLAGTGFGRGNFDVTLAVDPNNPNVVYLGGTSQYQSSGLLRVDATGVDDAHAFYLSNNLPDGGQRRTSTTGPLTEANPNLPKPPIPPPSPFYPDVEQFVNLVRNPNAPFVSNATVLVTNAGGFSNDGGNVQWIPFDQALQPDPFSTDPTDPNSVPTRGQHAMIAMVDPLTGKTRLIFGDDQGIYTAVDAGDGTLVGSVGGLALGARGGLGSPFGDTRVVNGSRNGDLQIAQMSYGAAQPSNAASAAAALPGAFYGNTFETGQPQSDPNEVNPAAAGLGYGDLSWSGDSASQVNPIDNLGRGSGTGIATDPTGSGAVYEYVWPSSLVDLQVLGGNQAPSDFFQVNGSSRTFNLLQQSGGGDVPDPQWPFRAGSNFAVNPINGDQVIMSSQAGRVFRTENAGQFWSVIGDPTDLDGSYAPALAFGAPDPNAPGGIGNLDNFLYAGTSAGRIFVTQTGGGGNNGNGWTNISAGLDGSPVQAIVTNPTRGSHEAYAVTTTGVFHIGDSLAPGASWQNITGNLFSIMHNPFGDPSLAEPLLRSLSSIVADWRYVIPDSFANPSPAATHPMLYVAGQGGVFRSTDDGRSWALFPSADATSLVSTPNPPGDGGGLPTVAVTGLVLSAGAIDPTTGRPVPRPGDPNLLMASTYGRGAFAIRLAPVVFAASLGLDPNDPSPPGPAGGGSDTGNSAADQLDHITDVATPFIDGDSEQSAFGNTVYVTLYDVTDPNNPVYIGGYNPADPSTKVPANQTDANGAFSVQVGVPLSEGAHRIGVQATDPAGARGNIALLPGTTVVQAPPQDRLPAATPPYSLVVDTTAPAVTGAPVLEAGSDSGHSNSDDVTGVTRPTFDVAGVEPMATLELFRDGVLVNTLFDVAGGTVAIQDPGPVQPDGVYAYTALQIDIAGNPAPAQSAALSVTIDTAAPASPTNLALAPGDDTGHSGTDGVTKVNAPTFDVSNIEPNATVELFRGATLVKSLFTAVGGTVAIQDPGPVADGTYVYTVVQLDLAGNASQASPGLTVKVDTTPPAAPTGLALDPGSDSGTLGDGITNVAAPSFDVSGIEPNATVELLRKPASDPNPADYVVVNAPGLFTTAGGAVVVQDPGPVADGTYTYVVRQTDLAGNVGPNSSPPLTITIIAHAPPAPGVPVLTAASDSGAFNNDDVTSATIVHFPVLNIAPAQAQATVQLLRKGPSDSGFIVVATRVGPGTVADPGPTFLDGVYLYESRQIDVAGNIGPASAPVAVTIDNTPPAFPPAPVLEAGSDSGLSNSDGVTNVTSPTFDVAGIEAHATLKLVRNGAVVRTLVDVAGGTVAIQDPGPVPDGVYTYTALQLDLAGNPSPVGPGTQVTIDTRPPTFVPGVPALEAASDSGASNSDDVTDVTSPTFDVVPVEVGMPVQLLRNGVVVATRIGAGALQDPGPVQPDGVYTYTAREVDLAGNIGTASAGLQVTIATSAPAPSAPVLEAGSDSGVGGDGITNVTSPIFDVNTAESNATVRLLRKPAGAPDTAYVIVATRPGPGPIRDPGPVQPDGAYTYAARQLDLAGNLSPIGGSATITVLTARPAAPGTPVLQGSSNNVTSNTSPVFNVAPAAATDTVQLLRNGVVVGSRTGPGPITDTTLATQTPPDGTYAYTAQQVDVAGNVSPASPAVMVTVISPGATVPAPPAPVLEAGSDSGVSRSDRITNVTSPTFDVTGTVTGATVELYRDGVLVGSRAGSGPLTDAGPVPAGDHAYTAKQLDLVGNRSAAGAATTVTIVTAPPTVPGLALNPADDSGVSSSDGITNVRRPRFVLAPTVAGDTYNLLGAGGAVLATATATGGSLTLQPAANLPEGPSTLQVRASDVAGNVSSGGGLTVTIDTTPPAAPGLALSPADGTPTPGGGATRTRRPHLVGTSSPGATVQLYDSAGDLLGTTTAGPGGAFTLQPTANLPLGAVALLARATDVAGNRGSFGPTLGLTVGRGPASVPADYNGDGKTDVAVYDQTTSQFFILLSGNGALTPQFGNPSHVNIPVAGDFDGDGKADVAIYDQTASQFFILLSGGGARTPQFGNPTHHNIPIAGDFDGDGKADFAIYDQTASQFFILLSGGGALTPQFGNPSHVNIPVAGDFDGDGKADVAIYDQTSSQFFILLSGGGALTPQFGNPGHQNVPIAGDFDGDGKVDVAIYDQTASQFFILLSGGGALTPQFGNPGHVNIPVAGDYDGDGRADFGIYDQTASQFSVLLSGGGALTPRFGNPAHTNIPVPSSFAGPPRARSIAAGGGAGGTVQALSLSVAATMPPNSGLAAPAQAPATGAAAPRQRPAQATPRPAAARSFALRARPRPNAGHPRHGA